VRLYRNGCGKARAEEWIYHWVDRVATALVAAERRYGSDNHPVPRSATRFFRSLFMRWLRDHVAPQSRHYVDLTRCKARSTLVRYRGFVV
jgi:hypothetical protein